MSVFENILKNLLEADQNDLHLKKFISKELIEKKNLPNPFHIGFQLFLSNYNHL